MNKPKIHIRQARQPDLAALQALFVDTIKTVCQPHYSKEQITVWTSSIENIQRWTQKIKTQYFIIAEIETKIVGFASLHNHQYVDLMYVHHQYQRQGIANYLYALLQAQAIKHSTTQLTSNVSLTALPFFQKKGFRIIAQQKNNINGIVMPNYAMVKELT